MRGSRRQRPPTQAGGLFEKRRDTSCLPCSPLLLSRFRSSVSAGVQISTCSSQHRDSRGVESIREARSTRRRIREKERGSDSVRSFLLDRSSSDDDTCVFLSCPPHPTTLFLSLATPTPTQRGRHLTVSHSARKEALRYQNDRESKPTLHRERGRLGRRVGDRDGLARGRLAPLAVDERLVGARGGDDLGVEAGHSGGRQEN